MEAIGEVFNEIQESTSVSQKQVYALLEQYEQNKAVFIKSMEQCYLKIIKNMLKAPRKLIEKYEKLTEKLFETGYRQYAVKEDQSSKKQKLTKKDMFALFQHFISFFGGALDCTQLQIRIFSSRIVFMLLKILPSDTLVEVIETKVAKQLILATLSLMKEKKGNLKQIGIKITSYLQKLMDREDLTQTFEAKVLRSEMMKSMCMDDQDQIRKLALINLEMNESTFPHLIKRIRDKNPEIRATVFKKLIKEQIPLANLNLSDIYKLIYDGLGSREASVRDACIRYLSLNYCLFKEDGENDNKSKNENEMEVEENKEIDGDQEEGSGEEAEKIIQQKPIKKKIVNSKETALQDIKIKILNFLKTFEIEKSLYYPELYESLENLAKETVKCILDSQSFASYLKDIFLNQFSLKKKKKHTSITLEGEELFLIRILCQMAQNEEERKELNSELVAVVDDCFPNGVDFSSVIEYYAFVQPNLFSLYQVLLMSELLINCDESGRNKVDDTLKSLVKNMNSQYLISDMPTDPSKEYNDIFYELDSDIVKNNIFAQSYFQSPIITCSYELLPIIVRILKKINSDGRVNLQMIQLISEVHEPLAKDLDNDSHFDLPTELERIQNVIQEEESNIDNIEKELQAIKKNKTKQNEIYHFEKQKEQKEQQLKLWQEKEESVQMKIFDISMKQLILVQALLTNCKVDPKDHAITSILQEIIIPCLHQSDLNIQSHSLKTLALYVLVDKKNCNDFFSTFNQILENNDSCQNCSPQEIISLRSIVDFLLLYDLSQKSQDDEDIDIPQTQELILKYAMQASILLRTISIEGLSKLLFNGKLQDPQLTISLLLVVWFDSNINKKEGVKAIQILSTLFKTYTASSYQNLSNFEKALELFSLLVINLDKKNLGFNDQYVIFDHLDDKFISRVFRVGINFISYEYHKSTEALNSPPNNEFPPQERLFLYLAYKCSKERRFLQLFEKITQYFDFYNRCSQDQLQIVLYFLREAVDNCPVSKQLHILENLVKDKIRAIEKKERQDEEDDRDDLRKVVGAENGNKVEAAVAEGEAVENAEQKVAEDEEKLFTINPRQKKICDKMIELFEANQQDIEVIIKNLVANNTLIQDSSELKAKRKQVSVVEEEEDSVSEDDEDVEQEEKPKRGRPSKRKAIKTNSDEDNENEEEEDDEDNEKAVTSKRRGKQSKKDLSAETGPKQRGRKKKELYQEEENDEDEDEGQDEEEADNAKKTKTSRRGKKSKEIVVILSDETESDDEDREEVINKRTSSRRAQKITTPEPAPTQKASRRGRSQKQQQEQEKESEDSEVEENEEDEEDVKNADVKKTQKQSGRRGRKPAIKANEIPKTTRRRGRRAASNDKKDDEMNEESAEEENKESDDEEGAEEVSSQPEIKTRQRGRPKKSDQKKKSNDEDEEKDEEEEVEEEVVEEKPTRKRGSASKKNIPQQKRGKNKSAQKSEDEQEEEEEPQRKTRGRGRGKAQEPEPEEESESEQQQQEEEEEEVEKPRRGRKPKVQNTVATKATKSTKGKKQQIDVEKSQTESEESENEEDVEVVENQPRTSRGRIQKPIVVRAAKGKGNAKKQPAKPKSGGSRNKMDEEEEENASEQYIVVDDDEEEEKPKARGKPKKASTDKQQAKGRGRRGKGDKSQTEESQDEKDQEEDEEEQEESAPQRTTRRQKLQDKENFATKKAVSSARRSGRNNK